MTEAAIGSVQSKKGLLKISQSSQENTCVRVSFLIKLQVEACNFIKKQTLAPVFSCEFYQIFKNNFFTEHLSTTASESELTSNTQEKHDAIFRFCLYKVNGNQ